MSWSVAGEKKAVKSHKQRKANKVRRNQPVLPPLPLNVDDWTDTFTILDQTIYDMFVKQHPAPLTAEAILRKLPRGKYNLKDVWDSLDSTHMKRYLVKEGKFDVYLITQEPPKREEEDDE
jgi:hypothetical protein